MARYHINPETGNPGICRTTPERCLFRDSNPEHYDTREEARAAYEASQEALAQHGSSLETGKLGEDGFLAEEEVDRIQIHGMSCPECGLSLGAHNLFAEESDGSVCDQGHVTFIDELRVTMTPENPSYRYLSKDAVKEDVWYHSSQDPNWLRSFENDEDATVHLGVEQSSYDRALYDYAGRRTADAYAHDFYLYEVRIDNDASVADELSASNYTVDRELEQKWINGEKTEDVTRYYNTVEGPGSISLVANPKKLQIIGKRRVSKDDARRILSIQNVRSADRREQPSWD